MDADIRPALHKDEGPPPKTSIEDHKATFEAFLNLVKWGVLAVALLLIGMAVFLL